MEKELLLKKIQLLEKELMEAKEKLKDRFPSDITLTCQNSSILNSTCCPCSLLHRHNSSDNQTLMRNLTAAKKKISNGLISITGMAHVILTVKNFARSYQFYKLFLGELCGLNCVMDTTIGRGEYETKPFLYYVGGKTAIGVHEELPEFQTNKTNVSFHQRRVGLHHLCLRARNHNDIDEAVKFINQKLIQLGASMVRVSRDDQWAPGYYSVLFEDPDGIRLEVNHIPGKGLLASKDPKLGGEKALNNNQTNGSNVHNIDNNRFTNNNNIKIRSYNHDNLNDIVTCTEIYNYAIMNLSATFEWDKIDVHEMRNRFQNLLANKYPIWVAEDLVKHIVVGYVYGAPHSIRKGYYQTMENSIYISKEYQHKNIGKQLLTHYLENIDQKRFTHLIAKIGDTSNIGSIKLHESFGFVKCGHLHNVGYKFGKYIDVLIYEKDLRDEDPASSYVESEDEDQERALL